MSNQGRFNQVQVSFHEASESQQSHNNLLFVIFFGLTWTNILHAA